MIDFPRYLAAKKTVDDRALNRFVWEQLGAALSGRESKRPLRILELGCGIGTMVERLLEWGLANRVQYVGIDSQAENIQAAEKRVLDWGAANEYRQGVTGQGIVLEKAEIFWQVRFKQADAVAYQERQGYYDLLVAQAFLDLIDVPQVLPGLVGWMVPGGVFYFTINFDGGTIFEPVTDEELEDKILRLYHQSMDERRVAGKRSGDSRIGRRLFAHMKEAGVQVLAAGSSDWVVYPGEHGYPADEAYFLHCILDFFEGSLGGQADLLEGELESWLGERREQIERRELIYIAHQLDVLGQLPILDQFV
jgi:SAM-dependent methyltransferase